MNDLNKKRNYCCGIVKTAPPREKTPEEIEKILQEIDERKFNPFVTVGGRLGNMVFPMDNSEN